MTQAEQQHFIQLRDKVTSTFNALASTMIDMENSPRRDPLLEHKVSQASLDYRNALSEFESYLPRPTA